jgi:hypothetical protein
MTKLLGALRVVVVVVVALLALIGIVFDARAEGTVPRKSALGWSCAAGGAYDKSPRSGVSPEQACGQALTQTISVPGGSQSIEFVSCGSWDAQSPSPVTSCYYRERYTWTTTTHSGAVQATGSRSLQCPDYSQANASDSCTCIAGYSPSADGQACTSTCGPVNGVASSGYFDIGTSATASPKLSGCKGECAVYFDGTSPAGSSLEGGVKHWYAKGSYHYTGDKCTASAQEGKQVSESKSAVPADSCAPGQGTASMNGKTVCVDQDTDTPTPESESKATTKTERTTTTNPDGSTTTTETTTKTDGKGGKETTVIRTTTRPDGSVTIEGETTGGIKPPGTGTDDSEDEPKGECEKNPSKAGCGGEAASVGELYTPKDKTMSGVLGTARDTFLSSPVGSAVGSFLVVSGGGSCPSWNAHIPFIDVDLTFDQFCKPFATTALALFKTALLLVASFYAFRIAVE